jgi:decaprenyl-phosphate phosphoribosyltransferase
VDDVVTPTRGTVQALFSAMRPRQWVKNVLVVMAPAAAGVLTHAGVLAHCLVAFVAFCLAASGVYLLNDVQDRPADQRHPRKRHRSIAAGQLTPAVAIPAAVALILLGLAATQLDHANLALATVVGLYVANALAYVYVLKSVAVIEMASVAAGFFLRAIAGASANHLFISTWFFVVVSF